ncbi:MAG: efflux RND transporter periplasmic adaptor subunit [Candidatus Lokiarchaeota archaeon]|nr:efflux RND transporter periplasmic adaptor subunit [Candidatus Lokiarchaeota archaeon]
MNIKILLILVVIIIIAGVLYLAAKGPTELISTNYIRLAKIKRGFLVKTVTVFGMAVPAFQTNIITPFSGRIECLYIENGSKVKKGQKLIKLHSEQEIEKYLLLKQKMIDTKYLLEFTQKEYDRMQRLRRTGQFSLKDMQTITTKLKQLQESEQINKKLLNLQQQKLNSACIQAQIPGIVLFETDMENGLFIQENQHILSIVNKDSVLIQAFINQDHGMKIYLDQKVTLQKFSTTKEEQSPLIGYISYIAPEIKKGLQKILIQIEDQHSIQFGTSMQINIPIYSASDQLIVPIEAIRCDRGDNFVYLIENGAVRRKNVTIGVTNHTEVEIEQTDGINEDAQVVLSHFDILHDGMKLTAKEKHYNDKKNL